MKNKVIIGILAFFLLCTTGCWNNRDLSEISISTAIGIDQGERNKVNLSVQIINPGVVTNKMGGSSEKIKKSIVISYTADTIFDAFRSMLAKVEKKVFYSTSRVIIIGEDVAKEGISEFLDFLQRDHETQYQSYFIIAKGTSAKEILELDYDLSDMAADFIKGTLENSDARGKVVKVNLLQLIKDLGNSGKEAVVGGIQMEKGGQTLTEGAGVFKQDKLVGWLNPMETRGYLFAVGKIKSTIINIPYPKNKKQQLSIEVIRTKAKRKVQWENEKPIFFVEVDIEGNVGEQQGGENLLEEREIIKKIEDTCNKVIEEEIKNAIKLCRKKYKSDIFGFGSIVHQKDPRKWKNIKKDWNDIFSEAEVKVSVNSNVVRSYLIRQPLKVE